MMKRHISTVNLLAAFSTPLLALALAAFSFAQDAPKPQLVRITIALVKPEMAQPPLFRRREAGPGRGLGLSRRKRRIRRPCR